MKANVNKVELVGFAGQDAESKDIKNNMKIGFFSLATSESYRTKTGEWASNTSWHRIVLWNENATKATEEVRKGSRVSLTGKLNYRTYETKSGEKRTIAEVIATSFEVLPRTVSENAS